MSNFYHESSDEWRIKERVRLLSERPDRLLLTQYGLVGSMAYLVGFMEINDRLQIWLEGLEGQYCQRVRVRLTVPGEEKPRYQGYLNRAGHVIFSAFSRTESDEYIVDFGYDPKRPAPSAEEEAVLAVAELLQNELFVVTYAGDTSDLRGRREFGLVGVTVQVYGRNDDTYVIGFSTRPDIKNRAMVSLVNDLGQEVQPALRTEEGAVAFTVNEAGLYGFKVELYRPVAR